MHGFERALHKPHVRYRTCVYLLVHHCVCAYLRKGKGHGGLLGVFATVCVCFHVCFLTSPFSTFVHTFK